MTRGCSDRIRAPKGAFRRAALRRRLVQGRAPRPARARRAERRRQDDAAARPDGRDGDPRRRARLGEGRPRRAARPAPAARELALAARVRAFGRVRSRRGRAGAPPPRGGDGCRRSHAGDAAPVRRGAEPAGARGRLRLARPRRRRAPRARLRRRRPRPRPGHVLGRRADAGVAGARARRRPRPAPPRRADEPSRHGLDRVARARAVDDRRRGDPRRPRSLVPRVGLDLRARAGGRALGLLPRQVARVAPGEGGAAAEPGEVGRAAGRGHRAAGAVRRALPVRNEVAPGAGEAEADRADREGAGRRSAWRSGGRSASSS